MRRTATSTVWHALTRLLAAIGIWAALGASAAGGEWRSWCNAPDPAGSLGWHFYCDRAAERQPDSPAAPRATAPPVIGDPQSATDRIAAMRGALEEARAEAILDPTPAKVTAYLLLQQETLQRAATFSDAFRRTRVVLAAPDRDTAQWSADSLGRSEIEEVTEGFSYGANTIRDGVSLTPRRELRALALPSEIMRLANLEGYLKFPGPFPVASIRLKYVARPAVSERFVARAEPAGGSDGAVEGMDAVPAVDDGLAIPDPAERTDAAPDPAPQSDGRAADSDGVQGELPLPPAPPGEGAAREAGADHPANGAAAEGEDRKPDEASTAAPRGEGGDGAIEPESTAQDAAQAPAAPEAGKAPASQPNAAPPGADRPDWG